MLIKIEGGIYGSKSYYDGEYRYVFFRGAASATDGSFLVMPYTIEVEIPDTFSPYTAQLEALKANKQKVLAENEVREQDADARIQEHLALTNESEL